MGRNIFHKQPLAYADDAWPTENVFYRMETEINDNRNKFRRKEEKLGIVCLGHLFPVVNGTKKPSSRLVGTRERVINKVCGLTRAKKEQ